MRTEYSPNARAKCQLCQIKISKGSWRVQLCVPNAHSASGTSTTWQSAHAQCYLRNVTDGAATRDTTQSMPFYGMLGVSADNGWKRAPELSFLTGDADAGRAVAAVVTAARASRLGDPVPSLAISLPTLALRECLTSAVAAAVDGTATIGSDETACLETVCLQHRLCGETAALMDTLEEAEDVLPRPEDDGDPLKGKFTQYSPNSAAHCRDCQCSLQQGAIRVGAHVFSSSSRHAGNSINYWCIECMCLKRSVQRNARLNPGQLGKALPGSELLQEGDILRICKLLGIPPPTAAAQAAMADGSKRVSRSGRQFGSW